jgi:lysophospholipase L1-like esterase
LSSEVFVTQGVTFVGTQNDNPDPENLPDPDHEGRGGFRIDEHMPTIAEAVVTGAPAIVLLHLGTNDIDQNRDLANAPSRLDGLIGQIVEASPDTHILVAQICNAAPQNAVKMREIQAYNAAIPSLVAVRRFAGERVTVVDFFDVVSPENFADTTYHPNKAGYDQMADAWVAAISALGPVANPASGQFHATTRQHFGGLQACGHGVAD